MVLDSKDPKVSLKEYMYNETRYKMLTTIDPERASSLETHAQDFVNIRWGKYKDMAKPVVAPKPVGEK